MALDPPEFTMNKLFYTISVLGTLLFGISCGRDGADQDSDFIRDTGGELLPAQEAYDVQHYDLTLKIEPESKSIDGVLQVRAKVLQSIDTFVLNLDPLLQVRKITRAGDSEELNFAHQQDRLDIDVQADAGSEVTLAIAYGGNPRVAPRPPWEGGFQWARTPSGAHWIATSCQMEGADLWWPCKDHPSDKTESMDLRITVPADLVCASNGRLLSDVENQDGTRTFHWRVSTPINNYCVALNIAPFILLEHNYDSVGGDSFPIQFWCLPESREQAQAILPEFADHMRFLEELCGPYPFRADKYGVVETPHLGMEHQTIIAYGNEFRDFKWKYDWLHHHELSHEWFANLVTAPDWNDFWIHEGFGSYLQKLYIEKRQGKAAYHEYLADVRGNLLNVKPVAPREPRTSGQIYFVDRTAAVGKRQSDNDIYYKGEWILHTLRFLIGEQALFQSIRKLAYPDAAREKVTDGSHCHFKTTDEYLALAEELSGQDLDWFFELYLRQPALPRLEYSMEAGTLQLRWITPNDMPFPMPVEVEIDGVLSRIAMPDGSGRLQVPADAQIVVDPQDWVLRQQNHCLGR